MTRASPRILAFDTSGPWCAAALMTEGRIVAERHEDMTRGQAERLMPMLEEVLFEDGAVWEGLDAIGVGTGPGNFTGIRVGVAAARGLALGLGIPAIGISAFEALRACLGGDTGRRIAVLPAPREQWLWEVSEDGVSRRMGLSPKADFVGHAGYLDAPALIAGDAERSTESYRIDGMAFDCEAPAAELRDLPARIAPEIARLSAGRLAAGGDIPRPAPLYVRPPDAAPASDTPPPILP